MRERGCELSRHFYCTCHLGNSKGLRSLCQKWGWTPNTCFLLCITTSHSRNPSSQMPAKGPPCQQVFLKSGLRPAGAFPAQLLTRVPSQQISQSNFFNYCFYSSDLKKEQRRQVRSLSLKLPSDFLLHLESTRFTPRTMQAARTSCSWTRWGLWYLLVPPGVPCWG